ncbi:phosphoenolpyruvate--protein phosphotransferase [Paenibacillus sp. FSL H8-0548]|uniref:phosphoenolpyruvate--protein phosphotransferase n=1 Tax=Paenibacillus sp. FSL H8-0548 TaxID=1920422 RepID=UPI00096CF1CF|nr:phosphoenolpyruvate--protein phosphotransferase [Paenibacillus sp. FSL H8-0548]OMF32579.1 phosphoenolpyruvate--protein phosphotransferase [Paenibacillus sp. FSL H8-0548]
MTAPLKGISASPGIAIARAFHLAHERFIPTQQAITDTDAEVGRFHLAVAVARDEIEVIRSSTAERLGEDKAEIFEGHLMILEDPDFIDAIALKITDEAMNAEFTLHETAQSFIELLQSMSDELLRGRAVDIEDVSGRIMSHLRGVPHMDLAGMTEECIIVAKDLTPSDTAQLNLEFVRGFVTEIGSRTSHSAIMARSLEIPAIVGIGAAVQQIPAQAVIVMDANEGIVLIAPTEEELTAYQDKKQKNDLRRMALSKLKDLPTLSADGKQVELAANIGKLEDIQRAIDNGAEGIGLFRTEFLYMGRSSLPTEEEQFTSYKYALEKMNPKPVVIRTLDIGGDKELPYMELPKESNPFLGQRALRLCLDRQDLFRTQLRALLRASRFGNLKIMFPMIAVLEELLEAKQLLEEEKQKLIAEGVQLADHIEIGMMVEIPAAAIAADLFAPEIDFFSIGTNDLIQYTMAADRMNETVAYLYQPWHPSLLRLIRFVIQAAEKEGKWVGMCGEMAGDETAIPLLLGLGLHEFSMSAGSILPARELISQLDQSSWSDYANQALTMRSTQEITQFVEHTRNGVIHHG